MFFLFWLILGALFIELCLIIAVQKHFRRTRFFPSMVKLMFFILLFLNDFFYLLTFFISLSNIKTVSILMEARVYFWFISIPFLVLFIETLQREKLTGNFIIISVFSSFLLRNCIYKPWIIEYSPNYGWILKFNPIMSLFIGIFLGSIVGILIYRYTSFFHFQKSVQKNYQKNYQKYILSGYIFAFSGEFLVKILHIIYLREIFLIIGFSITTFLYLRHPNAIFITQIKVFQFLIMDEESGMILFQQGKDIQFIDPSFFTSTIIQQRLANTHSKIQELIFPDRIFLLEYKSIQNRSLSAILLIDKKFFGINKILQYLLTQFISNYKSELIEKMDDLTLYATFSAKIESIFRNLPFEKVIHE